METLMPLVGILLAAALLVYIVLRLLKLQFPTVKEGYAAVVERMGRFERIAGPGQIWLVGRFEEIDHLVPIRTQGEAYEYSELWIKDFVPVNAKLTLSYHRSFEGMSLEEQKKIAYYPLDEWKKIARAQIERVLQDVLPTVDFTQALSANPTQRANLEQTLARALGQRLKAHGMLLDDQYGLTVNTLGLPEKLRETLVRVSNIKIDVNVRSSLISELMHQYPGHSEAFFMTLAGFLTGQQVPTTTMMPPMLFTDRAPSTVLPPSKPVQLPPPIIGPADEDTEPEVWKILKPPPTDADDVRGTE